MTIRVDATKQQLANTYTTLGTFLGVTTSDPGADPAQSPYPEPAGGMRVATTWQTGIEPGVMQGTPCLLQYDSVGTVDFAILCSQASGPTMIDNCPIASADLDATNGQIVLTPTYTQT